MISWPSCGCLVVIISSIFGAIEEDAPVSFSGDWLRFLILMYAAVASATGGTACSQPLSTLTGTSSAKAALNAAKEQEKKESDWDGGLIHRIQDTG